MGSFWVEYLLKVSWTVRQFRILRERIVFLVDAVVQKLHLAVIVGAWLDFK